MSKKKNKDTQLKIKKTDRINKLQEDKLIKCPIVCFVIETVIQHYQLSRPLEKRRVLIIQVIIDLCMNNAKLIK